MKNNCKDKNLFSINNENREQRLVRMTNYSIDGYCMSKNGQQKSLSQAERLFK